MQAPCAEKMCAEKARPLRRSRARFPLLSPAVTSSPGAGEVFPQRGSQAINLDAKGLSAMRKIPAVLLALPVGELSKPEALTERAYAVALSAKVSSTAKAFPPRRRFRRKQARQLPFVFTTPSCENAMPERPQMLRHCSIKNNFSADYGQSARGGHLKSSRPQRKRLQRLYPVEQIL